MSFRCSTPETSMGFISRLQTARALSCSNDRAQARAAYVRNVDRAAYLVYGKIERTRELRKGKKKKETESVCSWKRFWVCIAHYHVYEANRKVASWRNIFQRIEVARDCKHLANSRVNRSDPNESGGIVLIISSFDLEWKVSLYSHRKNNNKTTSLKREYLF